MEDTSICSKKKKDGYLSEGKEVLLCFQVLSFFSCFISFSYSSLYCPLPIFPLSLPTFTAIPVLLPPSLYFPQPYLFPLFSYKACSVNSSSYSFYISFLPLSISLSLSHLLFSISLCIFISLVVLMRLDLTKCFEHAIMSPLLCCVPWCFILFQAVLHFIL